MKKKPGPHKRGLQVVWQRDRFSELLERIYDEGFFIAMVYPLASADQRGRHYGQPWVEPRPPMSAAEALECHEVRWGHRDGNVLRLFPNATDGNVHLYETL